MRWYAIKLAFRKNAIHAIHQARREIDEQEARDDGPGSEDEEKEEIFDETEFRMEQEGQPTMESLSHKINLVLETLQKSSRKIER